MQVHNNNHAENLYHIRKPNLNSDTYFTLLKTIHIASILNQHCSTAMKKENKRYRYISYNFAF